MNGRVTPGPMKGQLSAAALNRAQEAADIVLGQRGNGVAVGPSAGPPAYTGILAKNATTGVVKFEAAMTGLSPSPQSKTEIQRRAERRDVFIGRLRRSG